MCSEMDEPFAALSSFIMNWRCSRLERSRAARFGRPSSSRPGISSSLNGAARGSRRPGRRLFTAMMWSNSQVRALYLMPFLLIFSTFFARTSSMSAWARPVAARRMAMNAAGDGAPVRYSQSAVSPSYSPSRSSRSPSGKRWRRAESSSEFTSLLPVPGNPHVHMPVEMPTVPHWVHRDGARFFIFASYAERPSRLSVTSRGFRASCAARASCQSLPS
mmetsp:Transcript_2467/g.8269  ORF Transcript_2467/g.8269 Transcript_2467/m.8269 type:complete len:218 (-) Transcript_2467:69-722(-)